MAVTDESITESRILLVEDHASFREALAHTLDEEPELSVVAQAGSLAEAREALGDTDIAVVDLSLPDGDGSDLIQDLHAVNPRCRVLILSASIDPEQHVRAVEVGAAGVMHKCSSLADIVDAVQTLRKGETPFTQENNELLHLAIGNRTRDCEARRDANSLTVRERDVLNALAEGLENAEIAQRLRMSIYTERAHMTHIYAKLGAHSRLQALVLAVRCGAVDIR